MPSGEREKSAVVSASLLASGELSYDTVLRQILSQHTKTEEALRNLGIADSGGNPLATITGIDQFRPAEVQLAPDLPLLVSVFGPPKAGKTTTYRGYMKRHPWSAFVDEKYKQALASAQQDRSSENWLDVNTEQYKIFLEMAIFDAIDLVNEGGLPNTPIIQGRGMVDQVVFRRTKMLLGEAWYPPEDLDLPRAVSD